MAIYVNVLSPAFSCSNNIFMLFIRNVHVWESTSSITVFTLVKIRCFCWNPNSVKLIHCSSLSKPVTLRAVAVVVVSPGQDSLRKRNHLQAGIKFRYFSPLRPVTTQSYTKRIMLLFSYICGENRLIHTHPNG